MQRNLNHISEVQLDFVVPQRIEESIERLFQSGFEVFDNFNDFVNGRLVYAGRSPIKSAILATDSTIIHYAKLHAVLTQGSPINVRIFKDRNKAAQWLGVPAELLTITG
ncbi:MAG TPA: hypothetical protein VMA33_07520 [Candidatus Tectomicrobia bacterium]|nr:hypothetical protein [Candidatus Tectomicrobia bacterium]